MLILVSILVLILVLILILKLEQQFIRDINEKYQTNKHKKSNTLLFQ